MNTNLIIVTVLAFCSFIISALFYNFEVRKNNRFSDKPAAFLPFCIAGSVTFFAAYFRFFDIRDFLSYFSATEAITVFVASLLLFLSLLSDKTARFFPLFLLIGAISGTAIMPADAMTAVAPFPVIYNRIILIAAWWFFAYIYRYSNTGDGMTALQSLTICTGVGILGIMNAIPAFLGITGLLFAMPSLALLVFTMPPARLRISDREASCIGFLIFGIMAWAAGEYAGSCVTIYALYILVDFVWAAALFLTFNEQYSDIRQNTAYCSAIAKGFTPKSAFAFCCRGQVLLLLFGSFQALSGVHWSLLLVSSFITMWVLYKLRNLSENMKLRDINRQVLDDLQERVNEIKQYLHKDDDI